MNDSKPAREIIVDLLKDKASTKQAVYITTLELFQTFKKVIKQLHDSLSKEMADIDKNIEISYEDKGPFEVILTFGGDIVVLNMHTNVFTFDSEHFIHKTPYVQEDRKRAYCGIIKIYNFLKDSIKYKRANDIGYMIGRIFVNSEKHFFVEGKRQLGFLYNDFENNELTKKNMMAIIESAIMYCLDFDLLTPPYNATSEMTVAEKLLQTGLTTLKTGKRLGFKFQADIDKV